MAEKKQQHSKNGFFSSFPKDMIRALSPARSRRSKTPAARSPSPSASSSAARFFVPRRCRDYVGEARSTPPDQLPEPLIARSGSLRPLGEALAPLIEGPDPDATGAGLGDGADDYARREGFGGWVRDRFLTRAPSVASSADGAGLGGSFRRSDLRLLLGVMGAPLAPIRASSADPLPLLSVKSTPIETSSAQYILQQYTAAAGGMRVLRSVRNAYAMGKVRMVASEFETATRVVRARGASRSATGAAAESGGFVLWQMAPDMWYVELAVGGSKVHAGSNGRLVWRHTSWLGAHAAKGPVRPLRRALQGLDPLATASLFANARCVGEKTINGEECFILKLTADAATLKARSEGPAEIIRHALFGYFSQRTGLLVHMEDSHLTRIQSPSGGDAVYWETTISSSIRDYRPIDGVMIAHAGRSAVTLFRFGEMAMSHTKTRMEEAWTIDEVAFNVPGLSVDCFIPPADTRCGPAIGSGDACDMPVHSGGGERGKVGAVHPERVPARSSVDKMVWRVDV